MRLFCIKGKIKYDRNKSALVAVPARGMLNDDLLDLALQRAGHLGFWHVIKRVSSQFLASAKRVKPHVLRVWNVVVPSWALSCCMQGWCTVADLWPAVKATVEVRAVFGPTPNCEGSMALPSRGLCHWQCADPHFLNLIASLEHSACQDLDSRARSPRGDFVADRALCQMHRMHGRADAALRSCISDDVVEMTLPRQCLEGLHVFTEAPCRVGVTVARVRVHQIDGTVQLDIAVDELVRLDDHAKIYQFGK